MPGIVEDGGPCGAVVHGQTVGWDAVPLERLLRATGELPPHIPYFIDNGAKAAGQAEMWFGGGRGARNAVVVLFGSGVGACVVTEEAAQGRAVEWGHLTVRVAGRRCRCGARGCLEAYAGASALVARWREAGGRPSPGAGEEQALTELLAAARADGGGGGGGGGGNGAGSDGGRGADFMSAASLDGGWTADSTGGARVEHGRGAELTGTASGDGGRAADLTGAARPDDARADALAGAAIRRDGQGVGSSPDRSRGSRPAVVGGFGSGERRGPAATGASGERCPDPVAVAVLTEAAEYLGAGLSDLINLFQPERVLIGGWAGLQLGDAFLDQVRAHALARALRHPAGRVRIEPGRLGPDAVTVGAAVLPLAAFFSAGGHRPAPKAPPAPAWRAVVEGRSV